MINNANDKKNIENESVYFECKNEIESFVNLLHGDIKKGTYFSVIQFNKETGRPSRTEFFDDIDKCTDILEYMSTDTKDTYISIHEFNTKRRRSTNHFAYTSFFYDIDIHNTSIDGQAQKETLEAIHNAVKNTKMLLPTAIISSGRGFHLYYVLDKRLPRKNLKWLYDNLSEYLANQIKEAIKDIDGVILDNIYKDSARVLRLPYTYNSNANTYSSIVYINKDRKFNIDDLRELANIPKQRVGNINKEKVVKPYKTKVISKIIHFSQGIKLHNDRLNDIQNLISIRSGDCTGHREEILFLTSYYSSFYNGNNVENIVNTTNNLFKERLNHSEVKTAIKSGKLGFKNWREDNKKGYNYKNITLIKMLEITDDEQKQLTTIISKVEKYRRAKQHNWYNTKRNEERKVKRDEKESKVIELLKDGATYKLITEHLQVSRQFIAKIKKDLIRN